MVATKKSGSSPKRSTNPIRIGIIGGSGLYDLPGFKQVGEVKPKTPFGAPSGPYRIFEVGGVSVAFLARHGAGHVLTPTELNARANIFGFKMLGVDKLLSISAVGSLKEEIPPEHFVVPDQIIDRTRNRPNTFFGNGIVGHVGFADPFCTELSARVADVLKAHSGTTVHTGGTYVCMEGPAFSTRAESHLYRSWGASIIGMTALPEAKLAREACMSYALLAMSTDYDCWKVEEKPVTVEQVIAHMTRNTENVKRALPHLIAKMAAYTRVQHAEAAKFAIMTDRKKIPPAMKKKMAPLWGPWL